MHPRMRVDHRRLNWGLFLIAAGAVPLMAGQGLIPRDIRWWQLWPLLLVGWGAGLLLRRTRAQAFGGALVATTFGLIVGGLLVGGWTAGFGCVGDGHRTGTPFATQSGTLVGPHATARLELSCGALTVTTSPGSAWQVEGTTRSGSPPSIDGAPTRLTVRSRETGSTFVGLGDRREDWTVTLPADQSIGLETAVNAGTERLSLAGARLDRLSVTVNAGDAHVDLGGATVSELRLTVNAGSGAVVFPATNLTGGVVVNAGIAKLCLPAGVGVRFVRSDRTLASDNFAARGLIQIGETWVTPGFDDATTRIELTTSVNAGSLELNPKDGCQ